MPDIYWNEEAHEWVVGHKGAICKVILKVFPYCLQQDIHEFFREAHVIAMEAVLHAAARGKDFESVFYQKFLELLQRSRQAMFEVRDSMDEGSQYLRMGDNFTQSFHDRFHREQLISRAADSLQQILTPLEQRVFLLLLGETDHGSCSVIEAAGILKISREAVNQACVKIIQKIQGAEKITNEDAGIYELDWPRMAEAAVKTKGRMSSTARAVRRERQKRALLHMTVETVSSLPLDAALVLLQGVIGMISREAA